MTEVTHGEWLRAAPMFDVVLPLRATFRRGHLEAGHWRSPGRAALPRWGFNGARAAPPVPTANGDVTGCTTEWGIRFRAGPATSDAPDDAWQPWARG